jgi:hypothetical protein
VFRTAVLTFAGGILLAFAALLLGRKILALGFFLGGLLAPLNLYGIQKLTGKVLIAGEARGKKVFWLWNTVRWVFLAVALSGLLAVSKDCLLGALGTYVWSLAALGWAGWKSAGSEKSP